MHARAPAVLLILALSLLGLGCGEAKDPVSELPPAGARECPHAWDWTDRQRENIEVFTGGRDDVSAFNDCQRFVVGSRESPAYGDVFAIFVGDAAARPASGAASGGMSAVALVAARGDYPPLGIDEPGFHCLLIDGRAGPHAMMAPAGPDADCGAPVEAEGHTLYTVRRAVGGDGSSGIGSAVPGVARWGFDGLPARNAGPGSAAWVQYAILPCGGAVCYVGPTDAAGSNAGFAPPSPRDVIAAMSEDLPVDGRVRGIDGWHDAQFLADPSSTDGRTRPHEGLPVGVLMPDSALADRTLQDFESGWIRVAEVAISASSRYDEKLNFAPTTGARFNLVQLCSYRGGDQPPGRCAGIPADVEERCEQTDPKEPDARRWRRRHVNAETGGVAYYCVRYRPHVGEDRRLQVPGVVRWRWLANDEETWIRCPIGCCAGGS